MYLPLSVEMTIAVGGILGFLSARALRRRGAGPEALEAARRRGVLLASGFLVGESFVGVGLGRRRTLRPLRDARLVGPDFADAATYLGAAVFVVGLFAAARFIRGPFAVPPQRRPAGAPKFRA